MLTYGRAQVVPGFQVGIVVVATQRQPSVLEDVTRKLTADGVLAVFRSPELDLEQELKTNTNQVLVTVPKSQPCARPCDALGYLVRPARPVPQDDVAAGVELVQVALANCPVAFDGGQHVAVSASAGHHKKVLAHRHALRRRIRTPDQPGGLSEQRVVGKLQQDITLLTCRSEHQRNVGQLVVERFRAIHQKLAIFMQMNVA